MTAPILTASNARRVSQAAFSSAISYAKRVEQTKWRGKLWVDRRTTYYAADGAVLGVYSSRLRLGTLRQHNAYLLPQS